MLFRRYILRQVRVVTISNNLRHVPLFNDKRMRENDGFNFFKLATI